MIWQERAWCTLTQSTSFNSTQHATVAGRNSCCRHHLALKSMCRLAKKTHKSVLGYLLGHKNCSLTSLPCWKNPDMQSLLLSQQTAVILTLQAASQYYRGQRRSAFSHSWGCANSSRTRMKAWTCPTLLMSNHKGSHLLLGRRKPGLDSFSMYIATASYAVQSPQILWWTAWIIRLQWISNSLLKPHFFLQEK